MRRQIDHMPACQLYAPNDARRQNTNANPSLALMVRFRLLGNRLRQSFNHRLAQLLVLGVKPHKRLPVPQQFDPPLHFQPGGCVLARRCLVRRFDLFQRFPTLFRVEIAQRQRFKFTQ